ncbi:GH92 family glycosyl hydrolase [Chitinophaga barathri]|uniref:Glycoside hydrolase family 92 protein n=1 Tax=Chitinophaga barathri TaxID=1647451 RepID=A0A3N4MWY1_9BACT|nr:GH92 family glycosyl hydrolase [Chitinophaga barathri]RPD39903.1 glycoside hydrolase family 92 protein [Chitinophaga barathri]
MLKQSLKWTGVLLLFMHQSFGQNFLPYVDPKVGNVGQLLQPTRPTVQLPNQVMRMHPIRADYIDDQIKSFPLLVVSHRLGEVFAVKPYTGATAPRAMTYDHDLEITRPWVYETYLVDDEITVRYTPGEKAGIFRFSFPAGKPKNLQFSAYNRGFFEWKWLDNKTVAAVEIWHDDVKVFMYGEFNTAGTTGKSQISFTANAPETIEFRYAVSFVSAEQAKKNFGKEVGNGISFETLEKQGEAAWAKVINQIQVSGGTEAQRRSFYTALYRCYERMVNITEDGAYYSGYDKKVHTGATRPFYVDDWSWDTYLAHHPLRTILNPKQEEDMLQSYVHMYEQSGWMPTFPVLFGDHACMNGFHSSVTFLDAYRKGLRNFDVEKAYEGMKKNATQATMLPWRNGPKGPLDDVYLTKGFFPALPKGVKETDPMVHGFEKRQAVAVTLGGAYDDWALSQLAGELKKTGDKETFTKRAFNYKNLWQPQAKMFMPKDGAGEWIKIDPKIDGGMGGREFYDENNGYTYQWQVQHDIAGLRDLFGGAKPMEAALDQLYREGLGRSKYEFWSIFPDATGLVGQYSMGNEPSFHIPYLYNYTGSPWKTQKRIRFLLDVWFKDNIFGIPGDEDGGGMCAFVVFSSMGFYPVTPGVPEYSIGSPLFEKVSIQLSDNKQFTVLAHHASVVNKYIQSAKFNGQPLLKPVFTHEQLVSGGTLELEMGPKPNKSWGAM